MHYDVFNGDADGIIALLQLRLHDPKISKLITGVKRDIKLLDKIANAEDMTSVTVLDISMESNKAGLTQLLERNLDVFYCDHHRSGEIPTSAQLTAVIDTDAEVCTSLLINHILGGKYSDWAIAAAFGDNLDKVATSMAQQAGLSEQATLYLKELGTLINYNGYGSDISDLHIEPAELFKQLTAYQNPFELMDDPQSPYFTLKQGYQLDYANVLEIKPVYSDDICEVYELPTERWARRISGVFGNELANNNPDKAHAVLTLNPNGLDYTVSVRAPLNNRTGADELCCQFATGGGRKAAAGINQLPSNEVDHFIASLVSQYRK
ncbi:DHH family phosphoesterase [Vibrio ziniensis]|uniref:DHH family phosphoesterase n=1 Tax=Vibrio ziniensis TaxID=2711221 RepID=A0A6G7CLI3_9VIBR|nr:DHH family phosphoesterase [Vibrio ziniensis]QIH42987.1 DHH family phosphoesterase [Vibrio ziniensis]